MKTKSLLLLILSITFLGCQKEDDDTDIPLTSGYTTINGNFITSDDAPLKGIELQLKYVETALGYSHSWLKRETTTDANGSYSISFNIKDDEVEVFEGQSSSYFELQIDLNSLNPDNYFLPESISETDTSYSYNPIISLKKDTTYNVTFYIPTKDYITVNLNNFKPALDGDHFEVQTFFPWGAKSENENESKLLNTKYGISSSGYDNFVAKNENQTYSVPVARNDTNIVRIIKIKNGIASPEDYKIFIPENNNIELTYEY